MLEKFPDFLDVISYTERGGKKKTLPNWGPS